MSSLKFASSTTFNKFENLYIFFYKIFSNLQYSKKKKKKEINGDSKGFRHQTRSIHGHNSFQLPILTHKEE